MNAYGTHVLIAAIKYLDGTPNGCEGMFTKAERRQAISIMMRKLSKRTQRELWKDRAAYWAGNQ
jgi:hypothetical protein